MVTYESVQQQIESQKKQVGSLRQKTQKQLPTPLLVQQRKQLMEDPRYRGRYKQSEREKESYLSSLSTHEKSLLEQQSKLRELEQQGYDISETDEGYQFSKTVKTTVRKKPTKVKAPDYDNLKKQISGLQSFRSKLQKAGLSTTGVDKTISVLKGKLYKTTGGKIDKYQEFQDFLSKLGTHIPAIETSRQRLPSVSTYATHVSLADAGITPKNWSTVGKITIPSSEEYSLPSQIIDPKKTSYSDFLQILKERNIRAQERQKSNIFQSYISTGDLPKDSNIEVPPFYKDLGLDKEYKDAVMWSTFRGDDTRLSNLQNVAQSTFSSLPTEKQQQISLTHTAWSQLSPSEIRQTYGGTQYIQSLPPEKREELIGEYMKSPEFNKFIKTPAGEKYIHSYLRSFETLPYKDTGFIPQYSGKRYDMTYTPEQIERQKRRLAELQLTTPLENQKERLFSELPIHAQLGHQIPEKFTEFAYGLPQLIMGTQEYITKTKLPAKVQLFGIDVPLPTPAGFEQFKKDRFISTIPTPSQAGLQEVTIPFEQRTFKSGAPSFEEWRKIPGSPQSREQHEPYLKAMYVQQYGKPGEQWKSVMENPITAIVGEAAGLVGGYVGSKATMVPLKYGFKAAVKIPRFTSRTLIPKATYSFQKTFLTSTEPKIPTRLQEMIRNVKQPETIRFKTVVDPRLHKLTPNILPEEHLLRFGDKSFIDYFKLSKGTHDDLYNIIKEFRTKTNTVSTQKAYEKLLSQYTKKVHSRLQYQDGGLVVDDGVLYGYTPSSKSITPYVVSTKEQLKGSLSYHMMSPGEKLAVPRSFGESVSVQVGDKVKVIKPGKSFTAPSEGAILTYKTGETKIHELLHRLHPSASEAQIRTLEHVATKQPGSSYGLRLWTDTKPSSLYKTSVNVPSYTTYGKLKSFISPLKERLTPRYRYAGSRGQPYGYIYEGDKQIGVLSRVGKRHTPMRTIDSPTGPAFVPDTFRNRLSQLYYPKMKNIARTGYRRFSGKEVRAWKFPETGIQKDRRTIGLTKYFDDQEIGPSFTEKGIKQYHRSAEGYAQADVIDKLLTTAEGKPIKTWVARPDNYDDLVRIMRNKELSADKMRQLFYGKDRVWPKKAGAKILRYDEVYGDKIVTNVGDDLLVQYPHIKSVDYGALHIERGKGILSRFRPKKAQLLRGEARRVQIHGDIYPSSPYDTTIVKDFYGVKSQPPVSVPKDMTIAKVVKRTRDVIPEEKLSSSTVQTVGSSRQFSPSWEQPVTPQEAVLLQEIVEETPEYMQSWVATKQPFHLPYKSPFQPAISKTTSLVAKGISKGAPSISYSASTLSSLNLRALQREQERRQREHQRQLQSQSMARYQQSSRLQLPISQQTQISLPITQPARDQVTTPTQVQTQMQSLAFSPFAQEQPRQPRQSFSPFILPDVKPAEEKTSKYPTNYTLYGYKERKHLVPDLSRPGYFSMIKRR